MSSLADLYSHYYSHSFITNRLTRPDVTLYDLTVTLANNNFQHLITLLKTQQHTLSCLTEISITIANAQPHSAPVPKIINSILNTPPAPVFYPQQYDDDLLPTPSPGLSATPATLNVPPTPFVTHITGPLVLHYIAPDLIVTWHSPNSPEVYQINLPFVSVLFTSFLIHNHLHIRPQFNALHPLSHHDLLTLSHDLLSILYIDPSVLPHLPHIPVTFTGPYNDSLNTIDASITSHNTLACSLKSLVQHCFPTWYMTQIPLNSFRKITITHHSERFINKPNGHFPVSISCYTVNLDITPCSAALQRISQNNSTNTLPSYSATHAIQRFLKSCPLHVYTTILHNVLTTIPIKCIPPLNSKTILKPRHPLIYYHPRFALYPGPDSSGSLSIHVILVHSHDIDLPSILSPGDTLHLSHRDAKISHMYHINEIFVPLSWPERLRIHAIIEEPFGNIYRHKFVTEHSAPTNHQPYWPFPRPISHE